MSAVRAGARPGGGVLHGSWSTVPIAASHVTDLSDAYKSVQSVVVDEACTNAQGYKTDGQPAYCELRLCSDAVLGEEDPVDDPNAYLVVR